MEQGPEGRRRRVQQDLREVVEGVRHVDEEVGRLLVEDEAVVPLFQSRELEEDGVGGVAELLRLLLDHVEAEVVGDGGAKEGVELRNRLTEEAGDGDERVEEQEAVHIPVEVVDLVEQTVAQTDEVGDAGELISDHHWDPLLHPADRDEGGESRAGIDLYWDGHGLRLLCF